MSTPLSIEYLEGCAVALLDYAETLGRPFHAGEQRQHRWILDAFEDAGDAMADADSRRIRYLEDLFCEKLKSLFDPIGDRTKQARARKGDLAERVQLEKELREGLAQVQRELAAAGVESPTIVRWPGKRKKAKRLVRPQRWTYRPLFELAECG